MLKKRALRRYHRQRLMKRRLLQMPWMTRLKLNYQRSMIDTPRRCSCALCRIRRKFYGPTLQEKRWPISDDIEDVLVAQHSLALITMALEEEPSADWRAELDEI